MAMVQPITDSPRNRIWVTLVIGISAKRAEDMDAPKVEPTSQNFRVYQLR